MSKLTLANGLASNRFWVKTVTKLSNKLKKESPSNPFLSHDEKTQLFLKWKEEGCIKSRDKLLSTLYPLAVQQVHDRINKNGNNNIPIEDLEQEANMALLDCLNEYEPEKGTLPTFFRSRLPKFFFPAIKQYGNLIRQPDNILRKIKVETLAFDAFVKKYGYYPNVGENFSFNIKDKNYEVIFGENIQYNIFSGNKKVTDEEDSSEFFDLIALDSENVFDNKNDNEDRIQILKEIISTLSNKEKEIIEMAFFSNLETSEILLKLTPHNKYDFARLYKRSKNELKIKTKNIEQKYIFYVFNAAQSKKCKKKIKKISFLPISHDCEINYTPKNKIKFSFGILKNDEIVSITLNGQDISNQLSKTVIFNNTYDIFKLSLNLKIGTIYSQQTYSTFLNKVKDKIRKKIVNYGFYK